AKHSNKIKRLDSILGDVQSAPMDDAFKHDIDLLVTECIVRAIEARELRLARHASKAERKAAEQDREAKVREDMEEGYVLTAYFYDTLKNFETQPAGILDSYGDWLYYLDLGREHKRMSNVRFREHAAPEMLAASKSEQVPLVQEAESLLAAGDIEQAEKVAQRALQRKTEDPGRALFVLARAASLQNERSQAMQY